MSQVARLYLGVLALWMLGYAGIMSSWDLTFAVWLTGSRQPHWDGYWFICFFAILPAIYAVVVALGPNNSKSGPITKLAKSLTSKQWYLLALGVWWLAAMQLFDAPAFWGRTITESLVYRVTLNLCAWGVPVILALLGVVSETVSHETK